MDAAADDEWESERTAAAADLRISRTTRTKFGLKSASLASGGSAPVSVYSASAAERYAFAAAAEEEEDSWALCC